MSAGAARSGIFTGLPGGSGSGLCGAVRCGVVQGWAMRHHPPGPLPFGALHPWVPHPLVPISTGAPHPLTSPTSEPPIPRCSLPWIPCPSMSPVPTQPHLPCAPSELSTPTSHT